MSKSINWLTIAIFQYVILVFTFRPITFYSGFNNPYIAYAVGILGCLLVARDYVRTKIFRYALFYVLITFSNLLYDKSTNLGFVLAEGFSILATGFIAFYAMESKGKQRDRIVKFVLLTFLLITVIYSVQTIVISRIWPGIMRSAALPEYEEICQPYFMLGLAPYAFPHALPCLIPILIMVIKNKCYNNILRILLGCLLGLIIGIIYVTEATGPMLVGLLAFILSIIAKKGSIRSNIKKMAAVLIVFLPIMISSDIQVAIIDTTEEIIGYDNQYFPKLEEFKASAQGDVGEGGDIELRGNLFEKTVNAIISSPIIGVTDKSYGNHNALLDRFAEYGIIGFATLLMYLIGVINYTRSKIPKVEEIYYLIGAFSAMLLFFSKSMFQWHTIFTFIVILPLTTITFSQLKKQ